MNAFLDVVASVVLSQNSIEIVPADSPESAGVETRPPPPLVTARAVSASPVKRPVAPHPSVPAPVPVRALPDESVTLVPDDSPSL
jgi:hypothetical protein